MFYWITNIHWHRLTMRRKRHAIWYHCLLLTLWYTIFCACPNISIIILAQCSKSECCYIMRTFVIWSVHFCTCRSGLYPRSVTLDSGTSCGAASFRCSFFGQFTTMAYTTLLPILLLPLSVYLLMESFVYVFECGCWSGDIDKTSMIIMSIDCCLVYSI